MKKLLLVLVGAIMVSCSSDEKEVYQEPKESCEEIQRISANLLEELLKFHSTTDPAFFRERYNQIVTDRDNLLKKNGCN